MIQRNTPTTKTMKINVETARGLLKVIRHLEAEDRTLRKGLINSYKQYRRIADEKKETII